MDNADLYLGEIDFSRYFSESECKVCGADSCKKLLDQLRQGKLTVDGLRNLPVEKSNALRTALDAGSLLPDVPKLTVPRPVSPEYIELNDPKDGDPVIVTGNNKFTQDVILTVLSTTSLPLYVLFSDTGGDTLDMAVVLKSFTPKSICDSYKETGLSERTTLGPLIIPGKAEELGAELRQTTNLHVEIGPVCAAELPLYLVTDGSYGR